MTARMRTQADTITDRSAMISEPQCPRVIALTHSSRQLFYTVLMDLKFARTLINMCVRKLPVHNDLQAQIFFSIQALQRLKITSLLFS
jgi:hypothetical protein